MNSDDPMESPDTEKSSNVESDSTSAGSDDDDSEMDQEDCELRRAECLEDMADLERQFVHLREQLFRERYTQAGVKLEEVRSGRSPEYLQPLEELQENMRIRTEIAGILREFKLVNIRNKTEAEKMASLQNFESEKALLWDSIRSELEDKIRRLEEDRNNIDVTSDLWNEQANFKKSKKKFESIGTDKRKKPVTVADILLKNTVLRPFFAVVSLTFRSSRPYIVYMLHENEILEDWTMIRKAMKTAKQQNELML